nr:hypothetical protein [Solirubrobacterales bacterium]
VTGCGGADRSGSSDVAGPDIDVPQQTASSEEIDGGGNEPKLCSALTASVTGRVNTGAAKELSGLVMSRAQSRVMWTHNDSGDRARVFAVDTKGRLLAEVAVTGAKAVDWEDIAVSRDAVLVGDIGDNDRRRESIVVYRIAEPRLAPSKSGSPAKLTAQASRIELRYPMGPRDAETLLRDPDSGALAIIEKNRMGMAGIFVARPSAGGSHMMRRAGALHLGPNQPITGGDISADGRTIVLRSYDKTFVWRREKGESIPDALDKEHCSGRADLRLEGIGEALALNRDGSAFYTVAEGTNPQIWRYVPEG